MPQGWAELSPAGYHFGGLGLTLGLHDLLSLFLLCFFHQELGPLGLLLGCDGGDRSELSGTPFPYSQKPSPHSSGNSPTCLASTAAVYSRLKLSSVMATSSRMRLKSLALSVSSRRINRDTWGWGEVGNGGVV